MPDRTARETVDDCYAKIPRGLRSLHHFFGSTFANVVRFAVPPDVGWQNGFVAFVDVVTHGLTDEVVADRPGFEAVFFQDLVMRVTIALGFGSLAHVEVIAPASQFKAIEAKAPGFSADGVESQIGPLAGEEC